MKDCSREIERLQAELDSAEALVIGVGAGMSASAGFDYSGDRFEKVFSDFHRKYGITDMYSGGFYDFPSLEEYWAWWSRMIWLNRYCEEVGKPYSDLVSLVGGKDYFIITTNVDHQLQKAGVDRKRLFYTQGDYGLFQCSVPCHHKTYDNEREVRRMVDQQRDMRIPSELVPLCPVCGRPMTTNLRIDERFVQDEGWYEASSRYNDFLSAHRRGHVLFLELGVGMNTPGIIKLPFWQMVEHNHKASYCCVNLAGAYAPGQIASRSIVVDVDIALVLSSLRR